MSQKIVDAVKGITSINWVIRSKQDDLVRLDNTLQWLASTQDDTIAIYMSVENRDDKIDELALPTAQAIESIKQKIVQINEDIRIDMSNLKSAAQTLIAVLDNENP